MSQELDEDDLDQVAGGYNPRLPYYQYFECYAEMPEMYEHMLQQDMKAMYQDYLEKGVTNR